MLLETLNPMFPIDIKIMKHQKVTDEYKQSSLIAVSQVISQLRLSLQLLFASPLSEHVKSFELLMSALVKTFAVKLIPSLHVQRQVEFLKLSHKLAELICCKIIDKSVHKFCKNRIRKFHKNLFSSPFYHRRLIQSKTCSNSTLQILQMNLTLVVKNT